MTAVVPTARRIDFKELFESLPGRYLILDPDLAIIAVSDSYLSATRSRRDDLVGRNMFDVFPDDDPMSGQVKALQASLDFVLTNLIEDTMSVQKFELRRPSNGSDESEARYWSPVNSPVLNAEGQLTCIIHRVEDVTDFVRFRASEKSDRVASAIVQEKTVRRSEGLSADNAQLRIASALLDDAVRERTKELQKSLEELSVINEKHRLLLRRIITLQEEEQHRIANDIHDDTLQSVIVAQMRLQMFGAKVTDAALSDELSRIGSSVGDAVDRLRGLIFELRPDELNHGLSFVLRRHLDDLVTVSGVTAKLTSTWISGPEGVEQLAIYRIAREALVNIRKHVSKGKVAVKLCDKDDGWRVVISDEGPGFVVSEALAASGHLGLTSMRERAEALGGWWRIDSAPATGTTVEFWIPRRYLDSHPAEPLAK